MSKAKELGVLLVQAAEITRDMPPGHFNALFIKNDSLLTIKDPLKAIEEAAKQNAFILWNHPGWKAQQPDTTLWWEKHTELFENDLMHGIEVFNSRSYYPEALDWANEKELTMFGNTGFKIREVPLKGIYTLRCRFLKDTTMWSQHLISMARPINAGSL